MYCESNCHLRVTQFNQLVDLFIDCDCCYAKIVSKNLLGSCVIHGTFITLQNIKHSIEHHYFFVTDIIIPRMSPWECGQPL